ncbi:MAG TPA: DUF4097 family beta strand repeat-containing protein [Actinotalea sp.]
MAEEAWVVDGPQIIEVEAVHSLRAALVGGRVDVVGRDEPGARIEVHRVHGRPLEVSLDGGELRVGYSFTLGGWDGVLERLKRLKASDAVDIHIAVQRDVAVKLAAVTADGLVADITGEVSVSTVSGSLVTDGTHGDLRANAVSGELALRAHEGTLRANSVSGSITTTGRFGDVDVSSVSGSVTVDATGLRGASLGTVSGDVTVRVPDTLGMSVAARTVSGRVVVDGAEQGGTGPLRGVVDVVTGDGSCRLQVRTVSGHLTVLRQQAARWSVVS